MKNLKVLYLFNNIRSQTMKDVQNKKDNEDHFLGMFRLKFFGVDADFWEIEMVFPKLVCQLIRKYLPIYFVHLPIFWKIFNYDIIFSSSAFGLQTLHTLFGFRKSKWVMLDFSINGFLNKKKWSNKIFKWMVKRSAGIVTISQKEADLLKNIFPQKNIKFIPFGTDNEFFKPQEIKEENQILMVGRDPGRDYATLFSACQGLGVKVISTTSRKLSQFPNIPDFVVSHNFDPHELVLEYSKSKIFVLPLDIKGGINEAMGCSTLVQAMSMGKAIIATRTPTTESYISHGQNGFLVEAGNVAEMRSYIVQLLNDENKRINFGHRARQFALKECSVNIFAERLAEFFKQIDHLESL